MRKMYSDYDYDHEWQIVLHDYGISLEDGLSGVYSIDKRGLEVGYDSTEWNNHIMVF